MKYNRTEFITHIAKEQEITKKDATAALDIVTAALLDIFETESEVTLNGFGKFGVKHCAERIGTHPKTGEELIIGACIKPYFKPSSTLKVEK